MTRSEYEIALYRPEYMHQVVVLLHQLYSGDLDINRSYFKWKYHDNPYSEKPLGVVALHQGEVIGFRGYFATKWHIPDKGYQLIVLAPGDTYVRPDHRTKGLSVAMGNMAMGEFASCYRVFLNTSAVKTSIPGYSKMGFVPIADKTYLMRYNLIVLLIKKFFWPRSKGPELSKKGIECGEFDDIIVAENPKPEAMSAIIFHKGWNDQRIAVFQDEDFFRWRFNNKKNRYIFYYFRRDNVVTGYVVILLLQNNHFGYVVDFAEIDAGALTKIFCYLIKKSHVDTIAIPNISLNEDFSQMVKHIGFKAESLIERRIRRVTGTCPIFVRPVQKRCVEDDWYIEGLDIRNIENWHIKGICNDGF
jgi:GNAT superfamily N-acetyltransferase